MVAGEALVVARETLVASVIAVFEAGEGEAGEVVHMYLICGQTRWGR